MSKYTAMGMFGYSDEAEVLQELDNCDEIARKWPHLVNAHIDSLHPEIGNEVRRRRALMIHQMRYENQTRIDDMNRMANALSEASQLRHPYQTHPTSLLGLGVFGL